MNKLQKFAAVGMMGLMASAAIAEAQTILRFNEGGPNRGTRAQALQYFADKVEEISGGDMKVDITWGGALLKLGDTLDGIQNGVVDMGSVIAVYTPNQMKALSIGDLPLGESSDAWVGMRAMYDLMNSNESLQASLAEQNTVYITNYHSTGVQIECAPGTEINSVEDIRGTRMRASGIYGKVLSDLGANLVNMTYNKVYQAYDTGLIDCDLGYFYAIRAYKLNEVVDRVVRADFGQIAGFAILANKDSYERLNEEQQAVLQQAGSEMIDFFAQVQIEGVGTTIEDLKSGALGNKVDVVDIDPAFRAALFAAAQPYVDSWQEEFTAAGFDGAAVWDQYNALLDKYTQERDTQGYPWTR